LCTLSGLTAAAPNVQLQLRNPTDGWQRVEVRITAESSHSDSGCWLPPHSARTVLAEASSTTGHVSVLIAWQPQRLGDMDADGDLDGDDLAAIAGQFGGPGDADFNGDGRVDVSDLLMIEVVP